MDLTISAAALGAPQALAARLSSAIFSSSDSHDATTSATPKGSLSDTKVPKSFSTTKSTFPSSWPGRNEVSMTGSATEAASAIVPGPALDTNTSAATIYSAMLDTNPRGTTLTRPVAQALLSSSPSTALAFRVEGLFVSVSEVELSAIVVDNTESAASSLSLSLSLTWPWLWLWLPSWSGGDTTADDSCSAGGGGGGGGGPPWPWPWWEWA
mmetsp:Transcript_13702/g.39308  ORF Transcript_13702/g.39308 Transcript_13702/m.39308 type:complete len:211 (-) Transcript_13702:147-779(-)